MQWQQIPPIPKLGDVCYEQGEFLLAVRRSQLYVLWNLYRREGSAALQLKGTMAKPHALFDVAQGLAWADAQLAEHE